MLFYGRRLVFLAHTQNIPWINLISIGLPRAVVFGKLRAHALEEDYMHGDWVGASISDIGVGIAVEENRIHYLTRDAHFYTEAMEIIFSGMKNFVFGQL
jgi:hypothetical protein